MTSISRAADGDVDALAAFLRDATLPNDGLREHLSHAVVARDCGSATAMRKG